MPFDILVKLTTRCKPAMAVSIKELALWVLLVYLIFQTKEATAGFQDGLVSLPTLRRQQQVSNVFWIRMDFCMMVFALRMKNDR